MQVFVRKTPETLLQVFSRLLSPVLLQVFAGLLVSPARGQETTEP
jgi:hypothetical protein